jgi:hypothetical protein
LFAQTGARTHDVAALEESTLNITPHMQFGLAEGGQYLVEFKEETNTHLHAAGR